MILTKKQAQYVVKTILGDNEKKASTISFYDGISCFLYGEDSYIVVRTGERRESYSTFQDFVKAYT